jgi:hypothetical protein
MGWAKSFEENRSKKYAYDELALKTINDGLGKWADALHNYRHGQSKEETVSPLGFHHLRT